MFSLGRNPDLLSDVTRFLLQKLDPLKRKKDAPEQPIICEFFGTAKAGKDAQLIELDRWFKRHKFQILIPRESAETDEVRSIPRVDPYAYEMRHCAYNLNNLLQAAYSRDYHIVLPNRSIIDNLCWVMRLMKRGEISPRQYQVTKEFLLEGPWLQFVYATFYLTCTVDEALCREYGRDYKSRTVAFGSRMEPKELAFMQGCIDTVYEEIIARFPTLPLFEIDTTGRTLQDVRDEILSHMLESVLERLALQERDLLPWSLSLLREKARMSGPELKFRAFASSDALRERGWHFGGSCSEEDIYITPKNTKFLENNECFHIRKSGDRWYSVYKKENGDSRHWSKIHVPIPEDLVPDILREFQKVIEIRKQREIFHRDNFVLDRDQVEDLGEFTEIKAMVPTEEKVLMALALELGFKESDLVADSYVKLKRKKDQ